MNLKNYIRISDAITKLLEPMLEVVIHDLKKKHICFISGNLSKRKIGDHSLLDLDLKEDDQEYYQQLEKIIYPKLNFDGRLIKSISIPLEENGKIQALMCINCDSSIFEQMRNLANVFLSASNNKQPKILFKDDWQEKLHIAINQYIKQQKWDFATLKNTQKKELICYLYSINAFSQKNSANYLAKILNMGRATIFKYLKILKTKK